MAGTLSMCSSGTLACLHQQVLHTYSAMLQLLLECSYFHSRVELTFILHFDNHFRQTQTFV